MEEYAGKEQHLSGEDEGWVAAGGDGNGGSKDDDAPDMDEIPNISALRVDSGAKDDKNDDDDDDDDADIPDMDDFDMCGDEEDDASALPSSAAPLDSADDDAGHILKARASGLSITCDKYYQTRGSGSTATTSDDGRWTRRRRSRTSPRSTRRRR